MSGAATFVLGGVRTPFVRTGGALANIGAEDLGARAVRELLLRCGVDPAGIDGVIAGQMGGAQRLTDVARTIALRAGIPNAVPALTVHRGCGSGLDAICTAADMVAAGRGSLFFVVGCESMSRLIRDRGGPRRFVSRDVAPPRGGATRLQAALRWRPAGPAPELGRRVRRPDPASGLGWGPSSDLLARQWNISREAQDAWALRSHQRARAARSRLRAETCDFVHDQGVLRDDVGVEETMTLEELGRLPPQFMKRHGTITAGNASQAADGAVAILVGSAEGCRATALEPLGRIERFAQVGCDPRRPGLGPVHAIHRLFPDRARPFHDIDLFEIDEAFAAQVLADLAALRDHRFCRDLGREQPLGEIPEERLNVNGGAIALGHPAGAGGVRLVLTALSELGRREARRALVTLAVDGGQGAAMLLRRD